MTRRLLVVGFYLAAGAALLIVVNADQHDGEIPLLLLVIAALAEGWQTGESGWARDWVWVLILIGVYAVATVAYADAALGQGEPLVGVIALLVVSVAALASARRTRAEGPLAGWAWVLLPWIVVALAFPFGDTNKFTGGDDLDQVAVIALFPALVSMLLILIGAGARTLYRRRRVHRPTARA